MARIAVDRTSGAGLAAALTAALLLPAPGGANVFGSGAPSAPESPPPFLLLVQQGCGSDCPDTPDSGGGSSIGTVGISTQNTGRITKAIGIANVTCSPEWVERRYRIDCLRWELHRIALSLPRTGDYVPVRKALAKATVELDAIARRYADPAAPPIRPNVGGKPLAAQLPPLIAVRAEDEYRALLEAEKVIEEAQTMLLRSAAQSERRMVAYRDIAAALDSTKVLLRSA